MSSTSPLYACYAAIMTALKGQGAWDTRVGLNRADSDWAFPYVIVVFSGGGERNMIRSRNADAMIVLVIKVVSDIHAAAAAGNEAVAALINDRGTQDVTTGALYGGTSWQILTSTREDFISFEEYEGETVPIFHEGARYRFMMEAI